MNSTLSIASFDDDDNYLEVLSLKKKNRQLIKNAKRQSLSLMLTRIFMATALTVMAAVTLISLGRAKILQEQVTQLQATNSQLVSDNTTLVNNYQELQANVVGISDIAYELNNEVAQLKASNVEKDKVISQYEARKELFDDYEYAIIRKDDGSRTDISYSDILSLKELVAKKGMSSDTVDLVLALAMTESNGNEKAKNKASTATGFGGFLDGTGEMVYTKLMGNTSYTHSVQAKDGKTNLQMMVYYLAYLDDKYDDNIDKVLNEYRGVDDKAYKCKVNTYLKRSDLSLATISLK